MVLVVQPDWMLYNAKDQGGDERLQTPTKLCNLL